MAMSEAQHSSTHDARSRPRLVGVLRALEVRLRFPLLLLAVFLVVGKWPALVHYSRHLAAKLDSASAAPAAVAADVEYFCPMCPGVQSDWPNKCPICNMALVRRKKGHAVVLPSGVVARMQLTPRQIQLAGVATSAVGFERLVREVPALGRLAPLDRAAFASSATGAVVLATVGWRDARLIRPGDRATVEVNQGGDRTIWQGVVESLMADEGIALVRIDVLRDQVDKNEALAVRIAVPLSRREPFAGQPIGPPRLAAGDIRRVYRCPNHRDKLHLSEGACPDDKSALEAEDLADNQRLRFACEKHPSVLLENRDAVCPKCGGTLTPTIVSYRPEDQVLAVPVDAVVDDGRRRVVYVDRGGGMFEGVEVALGPRAERFYSVIQGLRLGERVASRGAFLIDAQTQLNPSIGVAYFGAAQVRNEATDAGELRERIAAALEKLPPELRDLASQQRVCPVTGLRLGAMGVPAVLEIEGRRVLLCCAGCEAALRREPDKYLKHP